MLGEASISENSLNEASYRVKKGRNCFLDEVNAYKMKKKKLEETPLESGRLMKAVTQ